MEKDPNKTKVKTIKTKKSDNVVVVVVNADDDKKTKSSDHNKVPDENSSDPKEITRPESRTPIDIVNLVNDDKVAVEGKTLEDKDEKEQSKKAESATTETNKATSSKQKPDTSAPKKPIEFNKDGKPRQKPGPKPGYKKKDKTTPTDTTTSETKTDDKESKTQEEIKKSDTSTTKPKDIKSKDLKPKEKKIKPKTTDNDDKSQTKEKEEKPTKEKETKPKPKKDGTTPKPKKEVKTKSALNSPSSKTPTAPPSELTFQEKMNQSLIQPNPLSKIPSPRIVEISLQPSTDESATATTVAEAATKTKSIQLTGTLSSLQDEQQLKPEEPIIALHVPLSTSLEKAGSKQVIFNVLKMSEDKYGFNKLYPNSSKLQDLMNLNDDIEIIDDDDDPEDDEDLIMEEPKIDGRKSQKGKAKIGQYDYEDPFIDDSEALWEDQRATTKDGFFVFYGPLVEENVRIERADGKVKRSRKRVANTTLVGNNAKKQNSDKLVSNAAATGARVISKTINGLPALAPKPIQQSTKPSPVAATVSGGSIPPHAASSSSGTPVS